MGAGLCSLACRAQGEARYQVSGSMAFMTSSCSGRHASEGLCTCRERRGAKAVSGTNSWSYSFDASNRL